MPYAAATGDTHMKLRLRQGKFGASDLFKFAFVGIIIGEGLLFGVPLALIFGTFFAFGPTHGGLAPLTPEMAHVFVWVAPLMVPMLVTIHAFVFSGFMTLGLWLYQLGGKLEAVDE